MNLKIAILFLLFLFESLYVISQNKITIQISAKQELEIPPSGRIFIYLCTNNKIEPRFSINLQNRNESGMVFAKDVYWKIKEPLSISDNVVGFPLNSLSKIDSGNYFLQALYDADTLSFSTGNFYSLPLRVHINKTGKQIIKITLDKKIESPEIANSQYIRYVRIKSKLLSDFWHRPFYVQAGVLLPSDYDSLSAKKYPVRYHIGGGFERFYQVEEWFADSSFQQLWLSTESPKMLMVFLDSDAPFGNSFQMNSENNGPFKDMLLTELIPFIEEKFHALATPESRFLDGGSDGGWVALALQIFNPDFFNGCWSFSPDPVNFKFFQLINIYSDKNAFINRFGNENICSRTVYGEPMATERDLVDFENVLGRYNTYITSSFAYGEFNAVYSPRGLNGLPKPIWDAHTGIIDTAVANCWKRWDLQLYLEKNWNTVGPKLQGKLHIWMGDMDTYYLNTSMRLFQDFLSKTENPKSDAQIVFGAMQTHNWEPPISGLEEMQQMMQRLTQK
ncbi:MAG TPA: alpha/beta hydrolase-fold protein [Parafilimonas sp.]|nr:alpha/beta hydrolase-fold protein [Parafilimonas sp.]